MNKTYPEFVVIGAMKSASTSIASLLAKHPQVFITPRKEPGFFSRDERYALGFEKYLNLYEGAKDCQITGEASTCYSRKIAYPLAAKRLHDHAPNCKLVYIMRHPVKRTYSHYAFDMAEKISGSTNGTVTSYSEALENNPEILDASDYIGQIKHYLNYFPRSQIHCIILEELIRNEEFELRKLCEFLEIDFYENNEWRMEHENAKGEYAAWLKSSRLTQKFFKNLPAPEIVKKIIGTKRREEIRNLFRVFFSKMLIRDTQKKLEGLIKPPTNEENELVSEKLKTSIKELETYLGKELKDWKK